MCLDQDLLLNILFLKKTTNNKVVYILPPLSLNDRWRPLNEASDVVNAASSSKELCCLDVEGRILSKIVIIYLLKYFLKYLTIIVKQNMKTYKYYNI